MLPAVLAVRPAFHNEPPPHKKSRGRTKKVIACFLTAWRLISKSSYTQGALVINAITHWTRRGRAAISGSELLDCLKSMTDDERREAGGLLFPDMPEWPDNKHLADLSGLAVHQAFLENLTLEQRQQLQQDFFL
jgi:hypothetical protein